MLCYLRKSPVREIWKCAGCHCANNCSLRRMERPILPPVSTYFLLLASFPTCIHNSHNTSLGKYNVNVASKSTKMSIHTCSAGFKNRERWNLKIANLDIGNLRSLWKISSLEIDFTCSDVHATTIVANLWTPRNPTSHPDSSFCTMIQQLNGYSW